MLLLDLISLIQDSTTVIISDLNNNEVARYDGKNSIPNKYNNKKVVEISAYIENKKAVIRIQLNFIQIYKSP